MARRPEQLSRARDRALRAHHLRFNEGKLFTEIAQTLGVTPTHAKRLVTQGAQLAVAEEMRDEAKNATLAELESLRARAYEYLNGTYYAAQFGKIVTQTVLDAEGQAVEVPMIDIGPNLAAMDRLLKLEKRRAEIFGYDAPKRSVVNVVTEDAITAEINRLEAEMAEADRVIGEAQASD